MFSDPFGLQPRFCLVPRFLCSSWRSQLPKRYLRTSPPPFPSKHPLYPLSAPRRLESFVVRAHMLREEMAASAPPASSGERKDDEHEAEMRGPGPRE